MVEPTNQNITATLSRGFARWQRGWWAWQLTYALWLATLIAVGLVVTGSNLVVASLLGVVGGIGFLYYRSQVANKSRPQSARYNQAVHRINPQVGWSLGLLTNEKGNSPLEKLQRQRLMQELQNQPLVLPPAPHSWPLPALLIGLLLLFIAGAFVVPGSPISNEPLLTQGLLPNATPDSLRSKPASEAVVLPGFGEVKLRVSPPAYTRQTAQFTELSTGGVPEGSTLTWQVSPQGKVAGIRILLGTEDSLNLSVTSKGRYTGQRRAAQGFIYRIEAQNNDTAVVSPFYQIQVLPDRAPEVTITGNEQYRSDYTGSPFSISASAHDDWGLQQVWLEYTVSRGSGENVQFTTDRKWLNAEGKKQTYQLTLKPRELGMQLGDELYYRLVAQDNKEPRWQESSTSSWYYHWRDSTDNTMLSSGLALDVEPEYFRSQRQIIIDTEKLLQQRSSLSAAEFQQRSETIGIDQKLLRLRYGKFLGEEFERSGGTGGHTHIDVHQHEVGEDHSHNHEHEHEEDEPDHDDHDHAAEPDMPFTEPGQQNNPLAAYTHAHDTEEGATFYEESVKVRLKAALAAMWDSELQLRTHQPRQALPYQYTALEIIKEIQQQTRVYVERVGFEAPPIEISKVRLSGERDDAGSHRMLSTYQPEDSLQYLTRLIAELSYWPANGRLSGNFRTTLAQVNQWLAQRAANDSNPDMLSLLNTIEQTQGREWLSLPEAQQLRSSLTPLLPRPAPAPTQAYTPSLFNLNPNSIK